MDKLKIAKNALSFKGAEGTYPFGPDAYVFKVMNKMFALMSIHQDRPILTVKCVPTDGEVLTEVYEDIIPGYHMNKKHWITIFLDGVVPDSVIADSLEGGYELVVSKLTKRDKTTLESL